MSNISITKCPYSKSCGGCNYQGIAYEKQLEKKHARLVSLIGSYGKVLPVLGMTDPLHYRNKAQYAFGTDRKKNIIYGMYKPSTHSIVATKECLINDTLADRIVGDICSLMPSFGITAYNEFTETGFLRHILVRTGAHTGQVMVVLVGTRSYFKTEKPFVKKLCELHPEITTIVLNTNDAFTSMVLGDKEKALYGDGYIEDELCSLRFRISPSSFYQVNPVQAEVLYKTAIEMAGLTGKERLLDAYCGTGTIGLCAAARVSQVVGVELNRSAVRDAVFNMKANGIRNASFVCADAGDFMLESYRSGDRFDVVVMDPPRTGSSEKFLRSLCSTGPKKIVYVSCGPDTLARDLRFLISNGYKVEEIRPVDMFPFTEHIETITLLKKRK